MKDSEAPEPEALRRFFEEAARTAKARKEEEANRAKESRPARTRVGRERSVEGMLVGRAGRAPVASRYLPPPSVPELTAWRRVLVLPQHETAEESQKVVTWLEVATEWAAADRKGEVYPDGASRRRPGEPQGELMQRATRPTRERIRSLVARIPKSIRPLVTEIGDHYRDPDYDVGRIRREAEATDWQVKVFKKELGLTPTQLERELLLETTLVLLRESAISVEAIAPMVCYGSPRSLRKLVDALCGFTPSQARQHLRRVVPKYEALGEGLLSWYFWVRHHRGELGPATFRDALTYLLERFGRT